MQNKVISFIGIVNLSEYFKNILPFGRGFVDPYSLRIRIQETIMLRIQRIRKRIFNSKQGQKWVFNIYAQNDLIRYFYRGAVKQ